jgi:pilus assembly protein Flp/PilA
MLKKFFAKLSDEEGQGLVEYALIIVLVSIVCMVALRLLGVNIGAIFTRITNILIAG